jgi:hypothetical protein
MRPTPPNRAHHALAAAIRLTSLPGPHGYERPLRTTKNNPVRINATPTTRCQPIVS